MNRRLVKLAKWSDVSQTDRSQPEPRVPPIRMPAPRSTAGERRKKSIFIFWIRFDLTNRCDCIVRHFYLSAHGHSSTSRPSATSRTSYFKPPPPAFVSTPSVASAKLNENYVAL